MQNKMMTPLRQGVLMALAGAAIFSGAVQAADSSASVTTRDWAGISSARASAQAQAAAAHASLQAAKGTAVAGGSGAKEIFSNPYRAYPPSCLNDGLPFQDFDTANGQQAQVTLLGDPIQCLMGGNNTECNYLETDTVTVWRVACSGGKSATLLEIDRPANLDGVTSTYPVLPGISVNQGGNNIYVRLANDPNTVLATNYANSPLINSDVFVLENFYGGSMLFDYNQPFALTIDNFSGTSASNPLTFSFPAYNTASYPAASQPLPITGYMSTNWFNPTQTFEGILVDVFDQDTSKRTFSFAWFTFDQNHLPFWLYGQGDFNIGDKQVTTTTVYPTGGSFAGTVVNAAHTNPWGTVSFTFPNCNTMSVTYNGDASSVDGPTSGGTHTKTFNRVANINSLTCE